MHRRLALTISLLALAPGPVAASDGPQGAGPTFDCSGASGQVETLICSDAGLSALDRSMAAVYAAATKAWPAKVAAEQRARQRGWIKGRNECWKADDPRACTEQSYRTRIVELQIQSGQLVAPTPLGYACTGGEDQPFFATFYRETDPPSAVITFGDDQVIAFATPSASGAKYATDGVEFWEKGGEASVGWFGTALTCRPRSAGGPPGAAAEARPPLDGTSWLLVQLQSMDDTTLVPEAGARYALSFDADGGLRVQADCNRGRGTWRSPDRVTLELGPVALTRVMCRASALESRFARDLASVRSYVVRDGKLYLSLMADGGIYAFEPVEPVR